MADTKLRVKKKKNQKKSKNHSPKKMNKPLVPSTGTPSKCNTFH